VARPAAQDHRGEGAGLAGPAAADKEEAEMPHDSRA
jgi:hypothetical protein